jgi:hypothetical protein
MISGNSRKKPRSKEQTDPAARPDSFHLPVSINKKSKRNESGFHKTFLCRICSKNFNANSTQMRYKKSYGKGRRVELTITCKTLCCAAPSLSRGCAAAFCRRSVAALKRKLKESGDGFYTSRITHISLA